jgi:hypothetical protein
MTRPWIVAPMLLLACGAAESVPAPPATETGSAAREDATEVAPDAPDALEIAVGTGEPGTFAAVGEGATLSLQRGCQGAQHVFTSVRVLRPNGDLGRVRVAIHRLDDDALVSVPLDVRIPFERDPADDDRRRITGLTPVVEVPRDVLGREVIVRVVISDEAGRSGRGAMRGRVEWGLDSCRPHG